MFRRKKKKPNYINIHKLELQLGFKPTMPLQEAERLDNANRPQSRPTWDPGYG